MANTPLQSLTFSTLEDTYTIPAKTSDLTNDSGFQTATQVEDAIDQHLSAVYKAAGSLASISALPAPSATYLGYVYDIESAFTTTADFVEGAGISYPAGTDVAIIAVQSGGSTVYKYDAMSGFINLSNYVEKPASPSTGDVMRWDGSAWGADALTPSDIGAAPAVTEVTISTAGAVTQALDPGKIYHFTGAISSLSLTLNAAASGQIAQYHFDFESGSTAATVTLTGVSWAGGSFVPEASKRYECDILNGYGVWLAW